MGDAFGNLQWISSKSRGCDGLVLGEVPGVWVFSFKSWRLRWTCGYLPESKARHETPKIDRQHLTYFRTQSSVD